MGRAVVCSEGLRGLFVGLGILLGFVLAATAAAPEVSHGQCLYLVGAPAGAPAASEEARNGGGGVFAICTNPDAGGAANRDGENMAQAWIKNREVSVSGVNNSCRAFAWVSHDFRVADMPGGPLLATVAMEGVYNGLIDSGTVALSYNTSINSGALLRMELLEINAETGSEDGVTAAELFEYQFPEGTLHLEGPFGRRLDAQLHPGVTYRVRLYLEVWVDNGALPNPINGLLMNSEEVNFGLPGWYGKGKFARYDSIEVCLGEPDAGPEILSRLDEIAAKVDGAVADIGQVSTDLASVGSDVTENIQKTDEALTDLGQVKSDLSALRSEVADNSQKLDDNSRKLDDNSRKLDENTRLLVENSQKLDQVLALLASLQIKECEQIRLLLTPEGRRASDCCGSLLDFPNGKDAPSCGGGTP